MAGASKSYNRDFDGAMSRPRKYTHIMPKKYNPRKYVESSHPSSQLERSRGAFVPALWDRDNWFVDEFWDKLSSGRYFVGFDDSLHTDEENDKYIVNYKEPGLNSEDVKIDFDKENNELVINMNHKEADEKSSSYKSYESSVKFSKPIKVDKIEAEIDKNGLNLVLPKEVADSERLHNIPIKSKA
ncbi:hypothetical protein KGF56_000338 [Candida oxycetoniae]|uniref:SHSP domain-containing protein n=1 Tax=Candida oxycetoniae TaxID=497107 RepID=A0AAI9T0R7_9ASCO|nr:uncharacterized protein KGF56_000338 [Candida oxycetoniae]KAI3406733.2 hypothetical protein KGF56_000338 [Candida oxycetoniae]